MIDYKITWVDYFENDAILEYDGIKYVFCFSREPSLGEALEYLLTKGQIRISPVREP